MKDVQEITINIRNVVERDAREKLNLIIAEVMYTAQRDMEEQVEALAAKYAKEVAEIFVNKFKEKR